jgi:hypothetical protein
MNVRLIGLPEGIWGFIDNPFAYSWIQVGFPDAGEEGLDLAFVFFPPSSAHINHSKLIIYFDFSANRNSVDEQENAICVMI